LRLGKYNVIKNTFKKIHVYLVGLAIEYTGYSKKNGAVSKVNKKSISHLIRVKRTPSQRQLSKFLMRYQQFASHPYCGAAGPVSKMASQHEKTFCVLRFEVSRSVITVHREFCARFRTAGSATVYV
jgi:hypothetical protein